MTSEQSKPENSNVKAPPQHDMGLMLQRRALYELERANTKPYRSPKYIVLVSLAVAVTMCLFLLFLDKSVKVAHHVIDIWAPVIFENKDASKQAAETTKPIADPTTPYMISVVPSADQQSSASSQRVK